MKVSPNYRQDVRTLIVAEAMQRFRERGIKAVKMDDISRGIHISKRTLYEIYENKEELLLDVLGYLQQQRQKRLQEVADLSNDVMDVLIEVLRIEVDSLVNTHKSFYSDIQRYPQAQVLLRSFYDEQRKGAIEFFDKGVRDGYFLPNLDYKIFMRLTANIMDSLKAYTQMSQISMMDVLNNYILVLMRGMCTQKGIAKLDDFVSKRDN